MTSVILQAQARNRDYYRLIGYQEENGQLESTESYLTYIVAYIKMYAAMIQVCTILFTHYCCMLDLYLHLSGKLMYCRNMTARLHLQTEIKGVRHPHGLAEGWKWLAMFLNALPATTATACALHAFLKVKMHLKTHSFCVHVVN